jgi:hypothetical protein
MGWADKTFYREVVTMTTKKKPCNLSRIQGSRKLGSISDKELIGRIRKLSLEERERLCSLS